MRELQRTAPVAAGLAEAAWLREDPTSVRAIAEPVYHEARRLGAVAHEAELAWWLAAAGSAVPEVTADHPYAMLAAGRWRDAARLWRTAGCPYEHALAMAQSPDPDDLLTALAMSDSMGAEPLARQLRRRLRARGITRLPRGPARTTAPTRQSSPAANWRCAGCSARASPTPRSPSAWWCPYARLTVTLPPCSTSSVPAPGGRPRPAPRSWAYSIRRTHRDRASRRWPTATPDHSPIRPAPAVTF